MGEEEMFRSPNAPQLNPPRSIKGSRSQPAETKQVFISPGFRTAVELAGWDEESLLAGLIVEDTPERSISKRKKRRIFPTKTPPTDSRRSKKTPRRNSMSVPVTVLKLDGEDDDDAVNEKKKNSGEEEKEEQIKEETGKVLPCMDQLREELSCAICLEICFEPSTTPCGHSFCKKCLKSAATKCGKKCPKCRQIISNGRACTVNTVLWNTVQLLFPKEIEARKGSMESGDGDSPKSRGGSSIERRIRGRRRGGTRNNSAFIMGSELVGLAEFNRTMTTQISTETFSNSRTATTVRRVPNQSEDAALALRLQRQEFLRNRSLPAPTPASSAVNSARTNLRAIAARAMRQSSTTIVRNRFSLS